MSTLSQLVRFLVVGTIGLLVLLLVTYTLTDFAHLWYFNAYILGTLCSWTAIFFMNSFFTFAGHTKERYATKYAVFLGMYVLAFGINASFVYAFTSLWNWYYLLSIIVATAITTLITFSISKIFIFTYDHQD
jgi:putative flippase GtrA